MKVVRYLLLALVLFGFGNIVYASSATVSLDAIAKVIKDGEITKEYISAKENEKNEFGERIWKKVVLTPRVEGNSLYIDFSLEGAENSVNDSVLATIQEDGFTLKSVIEFNEKEMEQYKLKIEVHNLIPLWEIEASSKFKEIKEYVSGNYTNELNRIIDRCYRQEMHVCRRSVSTYGEWEYVSDVELNDEPANYVLSVLKEEKRAADNDKFIAILTLIGIGLFILMMILKSGSSGNKRQG